MTYTGAEFSEDELFKEVKDLAKGENVSTLTQFKDLVDEVVEDKRIYGFFSDDEDLTQVKENLISRWPEIEEERENKNVSKILE